MNPQDLPKGPSIEAPISGKTANPAGVYVHVASGAEVIVMPDSKSTGQQDALIRLGYVWKRPAPSRDELHAMQQAQAEKDGAKSTEAHSGNFGKYNPDALRYNMTSENTGEGSDNMSTDAESNGTPAQADPNAAADAQAKLDETSASETDSSPEETAPADDDSSDDAKPSEETETNNAESTPEAPEAPAEPATEGNA